MAERRVARQATLPQPLAAALQREAQRVGYSRAGLIYRLLNDLVHGAYLSEWSQAVAAPKGSWTMQPRTEQPGVEPQRVINVSLSADEVDDVRASAPGRRLSWIINQMIELFVSRAYVPFWADAAAVDGSTDEAASEPHITEAP